MKKLSVKKTVAIIVAAVILIGAAVWGIIFFNKNNPNKLTPESGFDHPNEEGVRYISVDAMRLYPIEANDYEPYITVGDYKYYRVWNEDPLDFLCYKENDYWYLVRNEAIEEPTIAEFNPISAAVYNKGNVYPLMNFFADEEYIIEQGYEVTENHSNDTWLCRLMADALTNSDPVAVSFTEENMDAHYYIRLYSQEYEGLYYLISFVKSNGMYYLRDTSTDTTVLCPRDVAYRIMGAE